MTLFFQKLSSEHTRKNYPQYFRKEITCFLILKDTQPRGLYGLIDRGVERAAADLEPPLRQGEGFLTIFPAFRYQLFSKRFFLALFDHAFTSGFDKVYTWTRWKSWATVLHRFTTLDITPLQTPPPWDDDPTKVWFVKDQREIRQGKEL